MHRRVLAALLPLAIAAPLAAQALRNAPARPPAEPFGETVFGTRVDDSYRWMERADRAEQVAGFIRDSSAPTLAALKALPGYRDLHSAVDSASQAGVRFGDAEMAGGKLFFRRTDKGAQLAKLVVRAPGTADRVLYDPEVKSAAGSGAINSYSVSPSGRTVALHTAGGGSEVGAIRFIDVVTGKVLPDKLKPVWGEFEVEWLDERTFSYTRMGATGADAMRNMKAHVRRLGGSDGAPLLGGGAPPSPDFPSQDFPVIAFEKDSRWVVGLGTGARADARVLVTEKELLLAGKPAWREIASLADQVGSVDLVGDRLYALTTKRNPNGEVIAIDLGQRQTVAEGVVVVPSGPAVLNGLAAAEDGLYVLGQTDGLSRLFVLARRASAPTEVSLPMRGLLAALKRRKGERGVTFAMQDWFTAPQWFRAEDGQVTPLGLNSASHSVAGARQIRDHARSADGTQVPLDILLPAGAGAAKQLPMLLEGYGGYGINTAEPYYLSYRLGLLTQGGALAYCGTRGGGERGRSWHEGGREANKPNAHADLIACGERLVELGWTTPQRLTVMGTSAGGLLAPPAALKRPDLFTGLIANVAILNPTRLAAANNGANQFAEMGDPNRPAGFGALMAQDAYQMLLTATDLPDTLLVVGLNDRRVDPWMSAKFAGRALERFGESRLVLIRTDTKAGHGVGSARSQLVDQFADMFAFVLNQAGAPGFDALPPPPQAGGPERGR